MTTLPGLELLQQMRHMPDDFTTRQKVSILEEYIRQQPTALTAADFVTKHYFTDGLYIRELHIPAGMITIGRIHKYPCQNFLTKGKRLTLVDDKIQLVVAPFSYRSEAGTKRISITLEDAIWTTVHFNPTNETDIATIERMLTADSEEEYQDFLKQPQQISHVIHC